MKVSVANASLVAVCLMLGSVHVGAQTIYRIVGADGKVTFSDKPPTEPAKVTATAPSGKVLAAGDAALPFELRQVVSRYPVSLYTGSTCVPCNSGRLLLQSRGVPFTEFTVSTNEDIEALQRLSGGNGLPFLMIGGQKIKGFSETEWTQFLNAASYPETSLLPGTYRQPPARPLVTVQKQAPAKGEDNAGRTEDKPADPAATPEAAPVEASNPGGIKF